MKLFAHGVMVGQTVGYATALESSWSYGYDPLALAVTEVVDPKGNMTRATFDTRGNQLSATDALGRQWAWTYDSVNNVASATAPNPSSVGPSTVTTTFSYGRRRASHRGLGAAVFRAIQLHRPGRDPGQG